MKDMLVIMALAELFDVNTPLSIALADLAVDSRTILDHYWEGSVIVAFHARAWQDEIFSPTLSPKCSTFEWMQSHSMVLLQWNFYVLL